MRGPISIIGACAAAALLGACGTPPKEQFYTLTPATLPAEAAGGQARHIVSVGPVRVPEMVDRPQFVIRQSPNRVDVIEQHRWAQSLRAEIARALAIDLGGRLADAYVVSSTDHAAQNAAYRILVDVDRFDAVPGEAVTVQATWSVRPTAGGSTRTGRSTVREPVRGTGYDELAAGFGRA
ncbi:MAG: rane integrity-associated transporter subunit PqiC, partial [Noviherbaspirillum sp.]|nr:rane integrity-associated transporter subunit PqiC [Noviherbaspirillum sp.]